MVWVCCPARAVVKPYILLTLIPTDLDNLNEEECG